MPTRVSMPAEEAVLVATIIGAPSLRVTGDEFGLDCRTPGGGFQLSPSDEVGAVAPGHPEEVVRVGVSPLTAEGEAQESGISVSVHEPVTRVTVLRTAVWFSAPRPAGETVIRDVVVPPGRQIDVHLGRPSVPAPVGFPEAGCNVVDAALCFYFAGGGVLVVGTDGWSYRLEVADGAEARAWIGESEEVSLDHVAAGIREAAG